jgi:hypothetical protein
MAHGRMMMGCVFLACLLVAASVPSTASAFVFKAGGTGEWRVPAAAAGSNVSAYNAWAQRNRFRVGDAIGECTYSLLLFLPWRCSLVSNVSP